MAGSWLDNKKAVRVLRQAQDARILSEHYRGVLSSVVRNEIPTGRDRTTTASISSMFSSVRLTLRQALGERKCYFSLLSRYYRDFSPPPRSFSPDLSGLQDDI